MKTIFKNGNSYLSDNMVLRLKGDDNPPAVSDAKPIMVFPKSFIDYEEIRNSFKKYVKEVTKEVFLETYDQQTADAILGLSVFPDHLHFRRIKKLLYLFETPVDLVKVIDFNMLLMGRVSINIKKLTGYLIFESTKNVNDLTEDTFENVITREFGKSFLTTIKYFI